MSCRLLLAEVPTSAGSTAAGRQQGQRCSEAGCRVWGSARAFPFLPACCQLLPPYRSGQWLHPSSTPSITPPLTLDLPQLDGPEEAGDSGGHKPLSCCRVGLAVINHGLAVEVGPVVPGLGRWVGVEWGPVDGVGRDSGGQVWHTDQLLRCGSQPAQPLHTAAHTAAAPPPLPAVPTTLIASTAYLAPGGPVLRGRPQVGHDGGDGCLAQLLGQAAPPQAQLEVHLGVTSEEGRRAQCEQRRTAEGRECRG